jgi:hypothetical protein
MVSLGMDVKCAVVVGLGFTNGSEQCDVNGMCDVHGS